MQVISDFLILRHRINKTTRTPVVDEETLLIQHSQLSDDNIRVYKEDMTKNYYLRMAMIIAIISCFVIGGQRLNNIENNINHVKTELVGCILPGNDFSMDDMLKRTRTMVTRAKIVLWSESAIVLGGHKDYEKLIESAYEIATLNHAYLGLAYIIPSGNGNKKKNMLTFIGPKNQTLFEYQKTHPVPLVESYSIESGPGRLTSVNINLPKHKDKNQTESNINVSGAICLDMDFPELLGQAASVDLVLSPAQTWSAHVGLQHLRMSSVRAIENGYWILRCDGGGASGLIDPYGRIRHVQIADVDHENLYVWEMPLSEKIETYYGSLGEGTVWGALILLVICELVWYFSWKCAEEDMESLTITAQEYIERQQQWLDDKYDQIFDREELSLSAQQSLI